MRFLITCVQAAGIVQWLIAGANFFLPRKLRYRENLARLSPMVRQVFIVHSVYIVLLVIFLGGLCVWFAPELTGPGTLGRTLSGFLAVFWIQRIAIQFFYYDRDMRRRYPVADAAFTAAFIFLGGVFAVAALGVLR